MTKIYTIYRATNTVNGKVYIGYTSNWPNRIYGHNHESKHYTGNNKPFYNAIKAYGFAAFCWEALYQSKDKEHTLGEMESYFIHSHRSWIGFDDCNGYNVTTGGEGVSGWVRSAETIERHRAKITGRKQTAEHVRNKSKSLKENGNHKSWSRGQTKNTDSRLAEMGEKVSAALKNKPKSDEHKAAMRNRPQDTQHLTCPHCGKVGDYKNMNRWHMDNCKHNPNKIATEQKKVTCTECGHVSIDSPNFYRYHNKNCKHKKD